MRRLMVLGRPLVVIALAAAIPFLLSTDQGQAQTSASIDVGDVYFCNPSFANGVCETTISVGGTVTWNWVGSAPHSVSQCDPTFTTCPPPSGFDSGTLTGTGQTFSHTFTTPGAFEYQCNIHFAGMRGRVNVVAAQVTPTATTGATQPAQTATSAPTGTAPGAAGTRTAAASPIAVPGTGGDAGDGGAQWPLIAAVAAGVLIALSGAGLVAKRHR